MHCAGRRVTRQRSGAYKPGWMRSDFQAKEEPMSDRIFVCPECKKPCCRDNSFTTHMQKSHQQEITDTEPYAVSLEDIVLKLVKDHHSLHFKCLKCDTIINSRLKLSAHLCVDQAGCVTCTTVCPDGLGLSNWQRVIFLKRKREYLCHTCGANFTDKTTFTMHVQSHGVGVEVKKFVCQHCPYATNNKFYFKIHMRGQHSAEPRPRPHVCELCGKTFVFKGVLEQHKQYMHVKDKVFQCHLCPKFFYRRQGLARHVRTHSGQRPWVCGQCGQGFTVKYNLKVHERLHSGERPYQCKQCDAAFAQKNSLNVHMKKHEGGGGEISATRAFRARETAPPASTTLPRRVARETEGLEPYVRDTPHPSHHGESNSPPFNIANPLPARQLTSPLQPHSREMPDQPHALHQSQSRESMGGAGTQYGYPAYPDFAMTVFPSLPGPSYQFMPVTRP
ncbi:gastrula zinc finger protein XlCGF57.1-like [Littorina saxatilis]|uniref:gastrula zinc finger protein XlCGF57.1-like n=1 Tax=Littorina saxatilis TaxID=31220 RepID=UPI0038B4AC00